MELEAVSVDQPGVKQTQHREYWLAIAALALSLLAYAFVPLIVRWCEIELSPTAVMFNRCWIAAVVLAIWRCQALWKGLQGLNATAHSLNFTPAQQQFYLAWATCTISFTAMIASWAWSLKQTSVATSVTLHDLTPLFVVIINGIWLQVLPNRKLFVGILVAVVGSIMLSLTDLGGLSAFKGPLDLDSGKILGDGLALLSALFSALYLMAEERLRPQVSATKLIFGLSCIAALLLSIGVLLQGGALFPQSGKGWLAVFTLAILAQILALGLLTYSLKQFSASFVALILLLDPVLTAMSAWFAFGETLTLWHAGAIALILVGIYLGLTAEL
jgi:drug/metabolite transporter (DMT)-like permease